MIARSVVAQEEMLQKISATLFKFENLLVEYSTKMTPATESEEIPEPKKRKAEEEEDRKEENKNSYF